MPRKTYPYSGEWKKFNVPHGVKTVTVTVEGAGSGTREGGVVTGNMKVDPKEDLWLLVGQEGKTRHGTGNHQGGDGAFGGGGKGGDGYGSGQGGNGGGGASAILKGSRQGPIKVVAGGAGGSSADSGLGGYGGAKVGQIGAVGTSGPDAAEASTGGTPTQAGKGGTSSQGTAFFGEPGESKRLGKGGKGKTAPASYSDKDTNGGGGGGGGFYPGGGGASARIGYAPATGGAGGSNFTGGLYSVATNSQGGATGDGRIIIDWIDPSNPNQPPVPPANIRINNKPIADELPTRARKSVLLKGTPDDPEAQQGVRLYVKRSRKKTFSNFAVFKGTYDDTEERDQVRIDGLEQDTLYYLRIHSQDNHGKISTNYRTTSFWTNRSPSRATLNSPAENQQFTDLLNITFVWHHVDPDPNDGPTGFKLRYRTAQTPAYTAGPWTTIEQTGTSFEEWTLAAGTFKGNTLYEWEVLTRDEQNRWGKEWSDPRSFYVTGETTPPYPKHPLKGEAVVEQDDGTFEFSWEYRTPYQNKTQERADIQFRAYGSESEPWTLIVGDTTTPGRNWRWYLPVETFEPNTHYEWQVRTWAEDDVEPSDWSSSKDFWVTMAPGSSDGEIIPSGAPQRPLGEGTNRVYVYDRGGKVLRGEITPLVDVRWTRKRDDMSHCVIHLDSWDKAGREFLSELRTWQHELVVFRDGVRVWEGPITRISGTHAQLEIEAQDVMAYVYRRILRQGYNDAYRIINGQQVGQKTVVQRATRIIMNCLAYDDPNILGYLTPIENSGDAKNSRVTNDFTTTAWEEIDQLAAQAGLDYVTVGRRIVLWDTHNPIGRLPEMRDGDFSDSPIVTEYGMSAANFFGVTNNDDVFGYASEVDDDDNPDDDDDDPGPTGWLEQLASAYGQSEADATSRELTREDKEKLKITLSEQAERNIRGRWPPPLVVRVPDNSAISAELNIGINQIVPGVWIPLRATETVRKVSQWQKLDSMEVSEDASGEKITVVMSPAPQAGGDPDDDASQVEDA